MSYLSQIRPAVVSTLWFTLLLGVGYPLAITAIAVVTLPFQAGGSLLKDRAGHVVGSALIAQPFAKAEYFHPRPSAAGKGYDTTSTGGSNYGPLNPDLAKRVAGDAKSLRTEDGAGVIPADAVTTSGSGLDPDISPANARLQVARVALSRGVGAPDIQAIVDRATVGPAMGFIGQPRVNVLKLNMALDARYPVSHPPAK
jgi:K+-transporting ATPase ATPase C chain